MPSHSHHPIDPTNDNYPDPSPSPARLASPDAAAALNEGGFRLPPGIFITAIVAATDPATRALERDRDFPRTPRHRWLLDHAMSDVEWDWRILSTADPALQVFHMAVYDPTVDEYWLPQVGQHAASLFLDAIREELDVKAITVMRAYTGDSIAGLDGYCRIPSPTDLPADPAEILVAYAEAVERMSERTRRPRLVRELCAGVAVDGFEYVAHLADIQERVLDGRGPLVRLTDHRELAGLLAEAADDPVARELECVGEWDHTTTQGLAGIARDIATACAVITDHACPDEDYPCAPRRFHFAHLKMCGRCFWCIISDQPAGDITPDHEVRMLEEIYSRRPNRRVAVDTVDYIDRHFDTRGAEYCTNPAPRTLDELATPVTTAHPTRYKRIETALAAAVAVDRLTFEDLMEANALFEDIERASNAARAGH
ncbi:hypothetical protein QQX10_10635 [Demequina sp. SYSU T00039]|uniref:Uncharacterized protein n=1 Tax=Demequina lignilytica TaxID=3051663 RepID=A0AAW7M1U4_9MICO|nr:MULTISPECIES: hypothetical protein [unclassified Demequina]MDN4478645.1 hypothetical protein [Demequina sp. SYSU T00039-1]MDN4488623.1 hypothetical protein [Demequina sp. SYSU T00039]